VSQCNSRSVHCCEIKKLLVRIFVIGRSVKKQRRAPLVGSYTERISLIAVREADIHTST